MSSSTLFVFDVRSIISGSSSTFKRKSKINVIHLHGSFLKTFITLMLIVLILLQLISYSQSIFVPKGRKCRLQEMHCDIMHPEKQCCPGTSCGVKRINNNLVNICMMCLDIGEKCGPDSKGNCCRGLKCQKITALSSACVPISDFKFYPDMESEAYVIGGGQRYQTSPGEMMNNNNRNNDEDPPISLASLLMLKR